MFSKVKLCMSTSVLDPNIRALPLKGRIKFNTQVSYTRTSVPVFVKLPCEGRVRGGGSQQGKFVVQTQNNIPHGTYSIH